MNSSIACLSNCTELTTYFLLGKYKEDINKSNKEGLNGRLANAWHDLLEEYWMSNSKAGNPSNVKAAVAKKVRKFSGFNQQDSNEFMTEFLALLSEDLNKADKKNYKELKEKQENETDLECAIRFWKEHLERNNSIVTDLFSGLLKSEVICNDCGFDNITFDPFNTLTLAIPDTKKYFTKMFRYDDITLFYIPKYCIKNNIRLRIRVKKQCPLKDMNEEIKKVKNFNFQIKKLKFMQVLDGKFIRFIDDSESKKEKDYVFVFDDQSEEGQNTKAIPLYMNKDNKNSSFPRLLFLKEDMNFGYFKKKIFYFARNFIKTPFNVDEKKEKCELDKEIKKYKELKNGEEYDEKTLFDLFDKEYDSIFNAKEENKNENIEKFLKDFPYNISIKRRYDNQEQIVLFNGKNNLDILKGFLILQDYHSIKTLIDKLESKDYFLFLTFKPKSIYALDNKLDACENLEGQNFNKKDRLTLDNLLEYFCSDEYLDKGNEWFCNKCKKKVKVKKKFSIFYVPRILIICLKRFSKEGASVYGSYAKNGELIDFPLTNLDMGKYVCGPDKQYSKYDLFAVSQHYGGCGGGHYTAVCKNYDGKWYDYNDSSCSPSSSNSVVSASAYVLFYRKQNW